MEVSILGQIGTDRSAASPEGILQRNDRHSPESEGLIVKFPKLAGMESRFSVRREGADAKALTPYPNDSAELSFCGRAFISPFVIGKIGKGPKIFGRSRRYAEVDRYHS